MVCSHQARDAPKSPFADFLGPEKGPVCPEWVDAGGWNGRQILYAHDWEARSP